MKRVNRKSFWVVLFLVTALVFIHLNKSSNISHYEREECVDQSYINDLRLASSDKIITINNNSDLKQVSSSGNGSQVNPYIIEKKFINGNGSLYCILVNNTNKFFTLKHCELYNSTYGILLNNVSNGVLLLNVLHNNFKSGVYFTKSSNNTISGNFFHKNRFYGLFLEICNSTSIEGNYLLYNNMTGIFLNNSEYINVTLNSIENHHCAIALCNSNYTNVIKNTGVDNNIAISEFNCRENYFEENVFSFSNKGRIDEKDSGDNEKVFIDFTVILLFGVIGFISYFIMLKFINKGKKFITQI